ncbi:MAG TPA: phospho-N-acetylmuramoyl-pentapeptide-transferase [Chloroflexota bacterium]|nr:phospho-N-acetylmuramoyl-pentapeptide-transferase [Chloroflexota bacterium]
MLSVSPAVPMALALALCADIAALVLGWPLPGWLRRLRAGKSVSQYQPAAHQAKTGTPSMAGLLFIGVTVVAGALIVPAHPEVWLLLALMVAAGLLGLIDDLSSSLRFMRGGMRARTKFAGLVLIAAILVAAGQVTLHLHSVRVPFVGLVDLGPFYWPVGVLVVVSAANAVNLTDGLDGLAGGTSALALGAYVVLALVRGQDGIALLLSVLVGALLGFLWHNVHPARFFMGDTGALALGALLAGASLLTGDLVVLPVIGAVFVVETLSVIFQIAYFKRTGGKRIFRASPLHNHFEVVGWPETLIVQRFWVAGLAAALAGIGLALTT